MSKGFKSPIKSIGNSLYIGGIMNKGDLVEKIAEATGLTKKDSEASVNAFVDTIQAALKSGEKVAIAGFGTFDVSNRKARTGRNPQTGEEIKIAASKTPKFKAGKSFKDMMN